MVCFHSNAVTLAMLKRFMYFRELLQVLLM